MLSGKYTFTVPTLIKHVSVLSDEPFIWRSTNVDPKKQNKKKHELSLGGGHISLRWSGSRIRSPHIVAIYHETLVFAMVICSFHCFKIGSCKFLAEGCSVYWLTAYCISMPPLFYWRDS